MSGYDLPGYDGWKLSTPWDDEVALTVSFTCHKCETEHDDYSATGSSKSSEVIVTCDECGAENSVDVGD
jgi:RNase P subunit RPR2